MAQEFDSNMTLIQGCRWAGDFLAAVDFYDGDCVDSGEEFMWTKF